MAVSGRALIVLLAALVLVGCSGNPASTPAEPSPAPSSAATPRPPPPDPAAPATPAQSSSQEPGAPSPTPAPSGTPADGGAPAPSGTQAPFVPFQAKDKIIRAPDGNRWIARGVTMFDYLFVSFETRSDYRYRSIYDPNGTGADSGVSEPTYYARIVYEDASHVADEIAKIAARGVNIIRVGVEPAMMYATKPYVDPVDGKTYPPDFAMLDAIVSSATQAGIVVQLQQSNDLVPVDLNVEFMKFLAGRYVTNPYVWINPANEPNGFPPATYVDDVSSWQAKIAPAVAAIRAPLPGGGRFLNPIAIDPPGWAQRIDLIHSILTGDPTFASDPNLIIDVHYYPAKGDYDFQTKQLPVVQSQWVDYTSEFCVVVGEAGIDDFGTNYDPDLNGASADATTWLQMRSAAIDFLTWASQKSAAGGLNGVIGEMWYGYVPASSPYYDLNTLTYSDGTLTSWGIIYVSYLLSPLSS